MQIVTESIGAIAVGDVISGKFRVDRVIGRGGNAIVVMATHLTLDERVALKFLTDHDSERVIQEAKACLQLKTEHIARVIDVGRHGSMPFIVMEYLEGKDLQQVVEAGGGLDNVTEAVELTIQVCEAVAEAHRRGIVHRDIKLANLFLVASRSSVPLVKLLDFGIASSTDVAGSQSQNVGTLHYMAPEALQGTSDDPRSDIWAIGVVLFELVTGWKPFDSKDAVSLIAEIYEQAPLSLGSIRDDVPPELENVIARCLEKEPANRFQTAGELAMALAPFAPSRARINIERAVASSLRSFSAAERSSESDARVSSLTPPSSRPSVSGTRTKTTGTRALQRSTSSRSLPSIATSSTALAATPRSFVHWAIAGAALVAFVGVLFVVKGRSVTPPNTVQGASIAVPTPPVETAAGETASGETAPVQTAPVQTAPGETAPVQTAAGTPPESPTGDVSIGSGKPSAAMPAPTARPLALPAPAPRPLVTVSAKPKPDDTAPPRKPTAPRATLERDPWQSAKPKLSDSPFR